MFRELRRKNKALTGVGLRDKMPKKANFCGLMR